MNIQILGIQKKNSTDFMIVVLVLVLVASVVVFVNINEHLTQKRTYQL